MTLKHKPEMENTTYDNNIRFDILTAGLQSK